MGRQDGLQLQLQVNSPMGSQVNSPMGSQGQYMGAGVPMLGGSGDRLENDTLRRTVDDLRWQLASEQDKKKRLLRNNKQVEYVADNSALHANTPGIQYRYSTNIDDKGISGPLLRWGATERGTECAGGEWLKVEGKGYLPMRLRGARVLKRKGAPGCASCWEGLCGASSGLPRSGPGTQTGAIAGRQAPLGLVQKPLGLLNQNAGICIVGATRLRPGDAVSEVFCRCRIRGQKVDAAETARRRDPCPVWESGHGLRFDAIKGRKLDFEVYSSQAHRKGEKVTFLGKATVSIGNDWLGTSECFEVELPLSRYLFDAGFLKVRLFGVRPVGISARQETIKATTFEDLDANGDGRVTREEFADAFQKGRVKFGKDGNLVTTYRSPQSPPQFSYGGSLYEGSTTASNATTVLYEGSTSFPPRLAGLEPRGGVYY